MERNRNRNRSISISNRKPIQIKMHSYAMCTDKLRTKKNTPRQQDFFIIVYSMQVLIFSAVNTAHSLAERLPNVQTNHQKKSQENVP